WREGYQKKLICILCPQRSGPAQQIAARGRFALGGFGVLKRATAARKFSCPRRSTAASGFTRQAFDDGAPSARRTESGLSGAENTVSNARLLRSRKQVSRRSSAI